jgi:hypothetical protein
MFNLIWQFAKTKATTIFATVNLKDILNKSKEKIEINEKEIIQKNKKEAKWQKYFPFTFFYGNGKFQPLYAWIFIFCSLAATMLFIKIYVAWNVFKKGIYTSDYLSTSDIATVLAFAGSLIVLYNNNKKKIEIPSNTIQSTVKKEGDQQM